MCDLWPVWGVVVPLQSQRLSFSSLEYRRSPQRIRHREIARFGGIQVLLGDEGLRDVFTTYDSKGSGPKPQLNNPKP